MLYTTIRNEYVAYVIEGMHYMTEPPLYDDDRTRTILWEALLLFRMQ